jgi:hypothetical protein
MNELTSLGFLLLLLAFLVLVFLYAQARLASPRELHKGIILQSETQEELEALLPSNLNTSSKEELQNEDCLSKM